MTRDISPCVPRFLVASRRPQRCQLRYRTYQDERGFSPNEPNAARENFTILGATPTEDSQVFHSHPSPCNDSPYAISGFLRWIFQNLEAITAVRKDGNLLRARRIALTGSWCCNAIP